MSSDDPSSTLPRKIQNSDLLALQSYVTAHDSTQYCHLAPTTVVLELTHSNLHQRHIEIRFDLHDTVSDLRNTIHRKTGTPPSFQHLQILHCGTPVLELAPERHGQTKLGFYSLPHGTVIHCVDTNPHSASLGGAYEDTSLVAKYEMSEDDYDKRRGTLRDWSRKQKATDSDFTFAKHAKQHAQLAEARKAAKLGLPLPSGFQLEQINGTSTVVRAKDENNQLKDHIDSQSSYGPDSVKGVEVGMRCQVLPGQRRGTVASVGLVPEIGHYYWVGVVFDEPVGKTNGTVAGTRYFEAPGDKYGGFVRAKNVEVGHFPERDILNDEDSDDEL